VFMVLRMEVKARDEQEMGVLVGVSDGDRTAGGARGNM